MRAFRGGGKREGEREEKKGLCTCQSALVPRAPIHVGLSLHAQKGTSVRSSKIIQEEREMRGWACDACSNIIFLCPSLLLPSFLSLPYSQYFGRWMVGYWRQDCCALAGVAGTTWPTMTWLQGRFYVTRGIVMMSTASDDRVLI